MKIPSPRILEIIIILAVWAIIVSALGIHYISTINNENQWSSGSYPYNNTNEENTTFNEHLNITNVQIGVRSYYLALIVEFDKTPDFSVTIQFKNTSGEIAEDTPWENSNIDEIDIYEDYNLNGTYEVVAYYTYNKSYIFDTYWLNLTSKIEFISHYEEETYYDWENQTEVNPVYVTMKNIGNVPIFIDNYNFTVRYASNNTLADYDNEGFLSILINKNESQNITLYPYFYLDSNQTYLAKIIFWGENSDVKFEIAYHIKT